jgi:hypothetical protein
MPAPKKQEIVVTGHLAWLAQKLGIPPWGQILIAIIVVIAGSLGATLWSFNGRMSKIEGQLNVLVAWRSIEDAARYTRSGNLEKASKSAKEAKTLISVAIQKRTPAPPDYFEESIAVLADTNTANLPRIASEIQAVRIALAEYRSVLQGPPNVNPVWVSVPLWQGRITQDIVNKRSVMRVTGSLFLMPGQGQGMYSNGPGAIINGSEIPDGRSLFVPSTKSLAINTNSVSGLVLVARNQALDGIHWNNVTFVNTHITYGGGDLDLRAVRFINCTFDAPATEHGQRLMEYAALLEPSLTAQGL